MDKKQKLGSLLMVAAVMLGVVGFLPAATTQAQIRTVWGQVAGASTSANLEDVYMVDTHTAFAAGGDGNHGIVYKLAWDGSKWIVGLDGVFNTWVKSVVAIDGINAWAVGDAGLIAHRGGRGWEQVPDISPLAYFNAIQMFGDGEEGWAAGELRTNANSPGGQPLMMHYKNGQWTRDTSVGTSTGVINSLHFATGNGYAVGTGIWRYANGVWNKEGTPPPCSTTKCSSALTAVRAVNSTEAWAVGYRIENVRGAKQTVYALHRTTGGWARVLPDAGVANMALDARNSYVLKGLTFAGSNYGLAVGQTADNASRPLVLTYRNGAWSRDNLPVQYGDLNRVSLRDDSHALAVGYNGLILSWGYGGPQPPAPPAPTATPVPTAVPAPIPGPVQRVGDPRDPNVTYFPVVGHTLRGAFASYWSQHGGLAQFGYPLTEEFIEKSPTDNQPYIVQYFERARFEWHPENRPPNDVLLGLLGRTITLTRQNEAPFLRAQPITGNAGSIYFDATGHNMAYQFVDYWLSHGGLAVYGYPISEAFIEVSPTDGRPYLVQYFERNRLEYHPEMPDAFRVSLGLLGAQVLKAQGWIR